jgi:voltage-dependent potassium channel beta subunit
MQYRRLGRSGLQVSELSLGSWVTYHNQVDTGAAVEMLAAAFDAGVNFFDNAEVYAMGQSEVVMGQAFKQLGWARHRYVVSTKFFWGIDREAAHTTNFRDTLNRKYLMQAIDGSLKRLQLDCVDLIYCHRPDPHTPIEETVWAMSDIIRSGKALYWGTSEWSAADIRAAWEIAERHHLHKPVMEQPQYNLFHRQRVEQEYARLYEDIGLGLTTWSPLASGLLTGKYDQGIPADARLGREGMEWLQDLVLGADAGARLGQVRRFSEVARALGQAPATLAIAWCLRNPNVSSVILGASRVSQLLQNLQALDVLEQVDAAGWAQVEAVFA